jgi:hypothetical protein
MGWYGTGGTMLNTFSLLWLLACGDVVPSAGSKTPPKPVDLTPEQAWTEVRSSLLDGRSCFRRMSAYCVDDPEYVDGHIQVQLDRLFDGEMPVRARDVAELGRKTQLAYATHQRTVEGAALVQAEVEEYYAEPDTNIVEGKGVNIRLGLVPGTLVSVPGQSETLRKLELTTDRADRGEVSTVELATQLTKWLEAFPEEPAVRLSIQVPADDEVRVLDIRYVRKSGHLDIRLPTVPRAGFRAIAPDLASYVNGEGSLHTSGLLRCISAVPGGPLDCADQPSEEVIEGAGVVQPTPLEVPTDDKNPQTP